MESIFFLKKYGLFVTMALYPVFKIITVFFFYQGEFEEKRYEACAFNSLEEKHYHVLLNLMHYCVEG